MLDIGGGTGVYARWLLDQGYDVTLIDPVELHITQATQTGVPATVGDARHLDHPDESIDVALLLGPLYHLTEPEDRLAALAEARRVLRPAAPPAQS
ncbi:MAG: class I SAM-dependent methyltransferase [Acidimicrobiales bacterium]